MRKYYIIKECSSCPPQKESPTLPSQREPVSTEKHEYSEEHEKSDHGHAMERIGKAATDVKGYAEYVRNHGMHFTPELAEHASKMMVNDNGMDHSWTTKQVMESGAALGLVKPKGVKPGDVAYLANMYYADLYPDVLKDEAACIRAAYKASNDADGYDGMIFNRWVADVMGKGMMLDWEKFV